MRDIRIGAAQFEPAEDAEEKRRTRRVHHDIHRVVRRWRVTGDRVLDPEAEEDEGVVLGRTAGNEDVNPAMRR